MSDNSNLNRAKNTINDEYYTLYDDVKSQLDNYWDYLKGKVVYCNCDNPKYSMFWKYFVRNFHDIGLKLLVSSYYVCKDDIFECNDEIVYKTVYDGTNFTQTPLVGDGDFRSKECKTILSDCDVVVTNPPFSLLKEMIPLLFDYDKKFVIIGTHMSFKYKNNLAYTCNNQLCCGFGVKRPYMKYWTTNGTLVDISNSCWLQNIYGWDDVIKNPIQPKVKYDPLKYKMMDFYDALNVDSINDIPFDYYDKIAVPINYIHTHNASLFNIVDIVDDSRELYVDGQLKFTRIIIQRKDN